MVKFAVLNHFLSNVQVYVGKGKWIAHEVLRTVQKKIPHATRAIAVFEHITGNSLANYGLTKRSLKANPELPLMLIPKYARLATESKYNVFNSPR